MATVKIPEPVLNRMRANVKAADDRNVQMIGTLALEHGLTGPVRVTDKNEITDEPLPKPTDEKGKENGK